MSDDEIVEAPVINFESDLIALGPLRRDLVPLYHRWRNDFWVQRTYGGPLSPSTEENRGQWYDSMTETADGAWFTIYERESLRPIGITDLFNIERDHGFAWWGMLIGEADARGKGYGTDTARLMLDFAFTALNLHVVSLTVDEFNLAARRAYSRAGYKEVGRIRQATTVAGRRYDRIVMDCLASEFESPYLRALLGVTHE